jgi:hypothetical protein
VALLALKDVDAVILATPDQNRLELTRLAAAADKHVLAEKSMAPTIAECDAMIAACDSAGVNLAVVKTERYRKVTLKAKQLIDEGVLGPVYMLRTVSSFPVSLARELPAPAQSVMAQIVFDSGAMAQMWISSEFAPPGLPSSEVRFQLVGRDGILSTCDSAAGSGPSARSRGWPDSSAPLRGRRGRTVLQRRRSCHR